MKSQKRCKIFNNYDLVLEIENFIKSYDPKNFKINGKEVWNDISVSQYQINLRMINDFIIKFNLKCEKIKKDCRCTVCYLNHYLKQDKDYPCKKPAKKDSINKCFCYNCNSNRIVSIMTCYEIIENPFKVYKIPFDLALNLYYFLFEKNILTNLDLEENKIMGVILRKCISISTNKNYDQFGNGKNNYNKDIGLPLLHFNEYEKTLLEKYKDEYNINIINEYAIHENNINVEERVAKFINNNTKTFYECDKEEVIDEIKNICNLQNIEANEDLLNAVSNSLTSPISLIIGEAGTGKTKSIEIIQKILEANDISSCGIAFTGKAVDKLINRFKETNNTLEKTPDFPLYTIHNFIYNVKNIPKVIIIDEASMLSTPLALNLFEKISITGNKVQLILVGDINQLPPIEWGRFFEALHNSNITKTKLVINFRTRNDCRIIIQNSKFFMRNSIDEKIDYSQPDKFELINSTSSSLILQKMKELYMEDDKIMKEKLSNNQLICPISIGEGCNLLNSKFQKLVKGDCLSYTYKNKIKWYIGDKVICTKNDHNKISNGTDGIIKKFGYMHMTLTYIKGGYKYLKAVKHYGVNIVDYDNNLTKIFPKGNVEEYICVATVIMESKFGEYEFPIIYHSENQKINIKHLNLAYAITTHKSQGSEYEWVIYYLPNSFPVSKSNVYTAITRSIKKFTVIQNHNTFHNATNENSVGDTLSQMVKIKNLPNKKCSHGQFKKLIFDMKYKCEDIWQTGNTKMDLICRFGHSFKATPNQLYCNNYGCKFCMNNVSSMELETANLCVKNGWKYISEYPCKYLNGRRYDFMVEIDGVKFMLELDGKQHFEFVKHYHKNLEFFNECIYIDALKTFHCIKNGIKILRIHYNSNIEKCIKTALIFFKENIDTKGNKFELLNKNLVVSNQKIYANILDELYKLLSD